MAPTEEAGAPANGKPAPKKRSAVRTAIPYVIVAAVAAAMLGWYFFSYVPNKLQYFVGLRFRSLAVAARQFKSKVDSLSTAVKSADTQTANGVAYLELLVPELHTFEVGPGILNDLPAGLDIQGPTTTGRISWDDVIQQAADASRRDFEDLLLARADGKVVWQRETTSPRVGNLAELLDAPKEDDSWSIFSVRWSIQTTPLKASPNGTVPLTATSRFVNLDGHSSILIVEPVAVTPNPWRSNENVGYLLAGIVSRDELQRQATHIPTEWIAIGTLPFVLLFLSLPFVKLATITRTERYGFMDVAALGVAIVLIVAIGGALPFAARRPIAEIDGTLERFAQQLDANFTREASRFVELTAAFDTKKQAIRERLEQLPGCAVDLYYADRKKVGNRLCDLWEATPPDVPAGTADLDVVVWVGQDAWQKEKWTTKRQVTALIREDFQHFRDVMAGRTWALRDDKSRRPFTIEPLRSPTTSEMAFVFAVPLNASGAGAEGGPDGMLALNVKPQSLVDPLVPPGYGFAVLASDGRVLFHSQSELSLEEDFAKEVGNPGVVMAAMRAQAKGHWTGDYHGRQHRFFTKPIDGIAGCPWQIVTFNDLEPVLAATAARQMVVAGLFLINLVVLALLVWLAIAGWKMKGRGLRDGMLASSAQSRNAATVRFSLRMMSVLLAISAAVLLATYFVHPRWLGLLYAWFVLLPILTIGVVVFSRQQPTAAPRPPAPAVPPRPQEPQPFVWFAAEIFVGALLIGAIPAAGFARLVYRLDESREMVQSLAESRDRFIRRETNVRGFVQASRNYSAETKKRLRDTNGVAGPQTAPPRPDAGQTATWPLYSYQHALRQIDVGSSGKGRFEPPSASPLDFVVGWLRDAPFGGSVDPVAWQFSSSGEYRLDNLDEPIAFSGVQDAFAGRPTFWPSLVSLVILGATFWATIWARRRLSTRGVPATPTIQDLIAEFKADGPNCAILLIGPPRMKKDREVAEAVKKATNHPPARRIRLLDAELTPAWINHELIAVQDVEAEAAKHGRPVWIHISNLEAQLNTVESRTHVLRFLERLLDRQRTADSAATAIVVTSTIDPILHFAEVFSEERKAIYSTAIPEVELNRSSLILSRFRRCFLPIKGTNPWKLWLRYDPKRWQDTLTCETSSHELLEDVGKDLLCAWRGRSEVPMDDLRRSVRSSADASYQLLWTSCTRSEKLALIQLAQEGLTNPNTREVVLELIAKGLVIAGPTPVPFNFTFRDFLRRIERNEVVQEWERGEGAGMWALAGRLAATVLIMGGLFYLVTQGMGMQGLLPLLSGSGLLSVPIVKDLVARVSTKGDDKARA